MTNDKGHKNPPDNISEPNDILIYTGMNYSKFKKKDTVDFIYKPT